MGARGVRIDVPWNSSQAFSGQRVAAQVWRFCKNYNCVCTYGQALGTTSKVKGWLGGSRWREKHRKYSNFLKAEHQVMRSSGLSAVEDIAVPLVTAQGHSHVVSAPPAPHRHRAGALLALDMDKEQGLCSPVPMGKRANLPQKKPFISLPNRDKTIPVWL